MTVKTLSPLRLISGVGVSCGIPDFRSKEGLYASLKGRTEHELDDPQQMLVIYFQLTELSWLKFSTGLIFSISARNLQVCRLAHAAVWLNRLTDTM